MEIEEIANLFARCQSSAFRLQRQAAYLVEEEADDFKRFLSGIPFPTVDDDPWLKTIERKAKAGIVITNLHVLPHRLTPYLRYAIDWSYVFRHLVGERILFIEETEARRCDPPARQDFWLFDDRLAVVMRYDPEGRFISAEAVEEPTEVERYQSIERAVVECAFDLPELLSRRRRGSLL